MLPSPHLRIRDDFRARSAVEVAYCGAVISEFLNLSGVPPQSCQIFKAPIIMRFEGVIRISSSSALRLFEGVLRYLSLCPDGGGVGSCVDLAMFWVERVIE